MAGVSGANTVLTALVGFESLSTEVVITPSVMADLSDWLTSVAGLLQPANTHSRAAAIIETIIYDRIDFISINPLYSFLR